MRKINKEKLDEKKRMKIEPVYFILQRFKNRPFISKMGAKLQETTHQTILNIN